jgi:alkanesulfonate monooxygenase SsuD/methylene tetrahydromethanopterin reductase-like flavin-dependent oxidoreductase (luciferase family)
VKYWCSVSFLDPAQWLDVARAYDELGSHSVMVADHLVYPARLDSAYPLLERRCRGLGCVDAVARPNDGWVGNLYTEQETLAYLDRIRRYRSEAGTGDRDFEVVIAPAGRPDRDRYRRLEDAGVTGVMCAPWMPHRDDLGTSPADVRARLERYAEQVVRVY